MTRLWEKDDDSDDSEGPDFFEEMKKDHVALVVFLLIGIAALYILAHILVAVIRYGF